MQPAALAHRLSVVLLALAAAGLLLMLDGPAAQASNHISGAWTVNYSFSCTASFTQDGDRVTGSVECGSGIGSSVEGSFDAGDRSFALSGELSGFAVMIDGTVSSDGERIAGTVSGHPLLRDAEFSGVRDRDPDPANMAGLWLINLRNVFAGHCSVDIEQDGSDVAGELSCEGIPTGIFNGTFNSETREMVLNGTFGFFGSLEMRVVHDGDAFNGIWRLLPDGPGGIMDGERVGEPMPTPRPSATLEEVTSPTPEPTPQITLPPVGGGGEPGGSTGWMLAAIAGALALGGASLLALRRA